MAGPSGAVQLDPAMPERPRTTAFPSRHSSRAILLRFAFLFAVRLWQIASLGARASLRGRHRGRLMMGLVMGWFNLWSVLADDGRRVCGRCELTSPVVPVRTPSCRSRTCRTSWSAPPGGSRCLDAPAELGAVNPHAMEDHSEAPGDGDNGAPHARADGPPACPTLSATTICRSG